jgi:hypothetical protein
MAAVFMAVPSADVNAAVVSRTIIAAEDDVEELLDTNVGLMDHGSSDLELATDGPPEPRTFIGLRFTNITIPPNTTISNATVQFTVDQTDTDTEADTDVRFYGEKSPNAGVFTTTAFNLTSRPKTTASVLWNDIPSWTVPFQSGPDQRSPNLAPIIQEIVNQPGWASGNALAIFIAPDPIEDNTGERTAGSFEEGQPQSMPPVLNITFGSVADIDGDGDIDTFDFNILRDNMAEHLDAPILAGSNGDLNFDSKIDLADFRLFKEAATGIPALEAALAGVPEPSAGVLAVLAMGGLAYGRRRKTS